MPTLSEIDVQDLAVHIEEESKALTVFDMLLEDEIRVLGQVQAHEALAQVIAAKQAQAVRLNALFETRVALVRQWLPTQLDGNPQALLVDQPDLLGRWHRLRARIRAAQEKNQANGRLIDGYLRQNQAALEALHAARGTRRAYTSRGKTKTVHPSRDLAVG